MAIVLGSISRPQPYPLHATYWRLTRPTGSSTTQEQIAAAEMSFDHDVAFLPVFYTGPHGKEPGAA